MNLLTVAVLGSGGADLLCAQTVQALKKAKRLVLRTRRHPVAAWLESENIPFETLDALYERAEDFTRLNQAVARRLAELCEESPVCYAVSDARSDTALRFMREEGIPLRILPGVSHAERCLSLVGAEEGAVCTVSGEDFSACDYNPAEGVLLCEVHSRECAGVCKIKLCQFMDEEARVSLIQGNALTGELKSQNIPLFEMDRQKHYDHLTALYVPGLPYSRRQRYSMQDYLHIMERLRAPGGCPWDLEQTHESLLPYLVEESNEFITSVKEGEPEHMAEELGDVLHQVGFHSVIGQQCGEFDFSDVTSAIAAKMIRRHPHVFGSETAGTAQEEHRHREERKLAERGQHSHGEAMRALSGELNPLLRAAKVQKLAALTGFDFANPEEAMGKVREETQEVQECLNGKDSPEGELGDLIFAAVNVCRLAGADPTIALNQTTDRFIRRFAYIEAQAAERGKQIGEMTLDEMNACWEAYKKLEKD